MKGVLILKNVIIDCRHCCYCWCPLDDDSHSYTGVKACLVFIPSIDSEKTMFLLCYPRENCLYFRNRPGLLS